MLEFSLLPEIQTAQPGSPVDWHNSRKKHEPQSNTTHSVLWTGPCVGSSWIHLQVTAALLG